MRFLVQGQLQGDIRADIRPEFLLAAFDLLNRMHYDPRIRDIYEDTETLARDVFNLYYYGALSADHRVAGIPKAGASSIGEDLSR